MSTKDSALMIKLKDGVQDTVVFLRMLDQFKIPAVMETRRKKLLQKLLNLQGDTIREDPPSYSEGAGGEESPSTATTNGSREPGVLTRKGSTVDEKVSEYARIETRAKEEMDTLSPRRKAAASAKQAEGVEKENPEGEPTEYLEPAAIVALARHRSGSKEGEGASERPVSTASSVESSGKKDETEQADDGAVAVKEKKKTKLGAGITRIRKKVKNINRGKHKATAAPATQQDGEKEKENTAAAVNGEDTDKAAGGVGEGEEGDVAKGDGEEKGGAEQELEEEVRVKSDLEKRVAKRFGSGFSWVKISGELKGTSLTLTAGTKEKQLELAGCMVSPSDAAPNGLELFSHKEQKQWVFRVESQELREKWVEQLQKAIDECPTSPWSSPPEEEPQTEAEVVGEEQTQQTEEKAEEEVSDVIIKVEPATEEEKSAAMKKKRMSFPVSPNRSNKAKPVNEIPDQGIQMKGYVHRKKGTFGGWERAYAVVTYAAIYFTTGEEVKEYNHVCMLSGSGTVKLEKKGHDKQAEGLFIKSGRNKETLSLPSTEIQPWRQVLEDVLGVSQELELGSEEEEEAVDSTTPAANTTAPVPTAIEEDQALYEELAAGEEIEEDIYEEFDDVKPQISPSDSPTLPTLPTLPPPRIEQKSPSPALPPRNEPQRGALAADPIPSLPPRSSPTLPPRSSPIPIAKSPQKGASVGAKQPAPPVQQDSAEEMYEDIVAPQSKSAGEPELEEFYEDVVSPQGTTGGQGGDEGGEELYEDVVAPAPQVEEVYDEMTAAPGSPTEDYTEMDVGSGPTEEYVVMERAQENGVQEVYSEVSAESPSHAPVNSLSLPPKGTTTTKTAPASSKIVKPPPPATYIPKNAGNLSHKGPKKSRFYEEWCAVEGTNLCVYKNQKDKRTVDKLSLNEFDMTYRPGKDGKYSFCLAKGDKIHHFNPSSKAELTNWISALRELAKSAILELPSGEEEVYVTTAEHKAESDEQISFKVGIYIRVISRASSDFWIGQLGTNAENFSGKIGKFPASKVTLAEDLYI